MDFGVEGGKLYTKTWAAGVGRWAWWCFVGYPLCPICMTKRRRSKEIWSTQIFSRAGKRFSVKAKDVEIY